MINDHTKNTSTISASHTKNPIIFVVVMSKEYNFNIEKKKAKSPTKAKDSVTCFATY